MRATATVLDRYAKGKRKPIRSSDTSVVVALRRIKPQEFRHHDPVGNMPHRGGTRGLAEHDDRRRGGVELKLMDDGGAGCTS